MSVKRRHFDMLSNFNWIGSGVLELQVAKNRYLPLTRDIALTTASVCTNMLYCDEQWYITELLKSMTGKNKHSMVHTSINQDESALSTTVFIKLCKTTPL